MQLTAVQRSRLVLSSDSKCLNMQKWKQDSKSKFAFSKDDKNRACKEMKLHLSHAMPLSIYDAHEGELF